MTHRDSNVEPSNAAATATCERVRQAFLASGMTPSGVSNSGEGGMGVYFISGERYADVECLNSGEVMAATFSNGNDAHVWDVEIDEIGGTIDQIREHLK